VDAIIMRALARNRDDRYSSAAELRRELAQAAAHMDGPHIPEEALAELMQRLFPDRIREKSEMLQRVRAGSELDEVPAAEVDVHVELPTIYGREQLSSPPPKFGRGSMGKRPLTLLAAALGVGLVAAAAFTASELAGAESLPNPSETVVAGTPSIAEAPRQGAAHEAAPAKVTLSVDSEPSGAEVTLGDRALGQTPLEVELESNSSTALLHVRRGPLEHSQNIVPDRDRHVQVILAEATPAPVPPPSTSTRTRRRPRRPSGMEKTAPPPPPTEEGFARFD